jgi:hypothetical protein
MNVAGPNTAPKNIGRIQETMKGVPIKYRELLKSGGFIA